MKLQSTDWLAEVCGFFICENTQVTVACDSPELIQTIAQKINYLLPQDKHFQFTLVDRRILLHARSQDAMQTPWLSTLYIKFSPTGELLTWLINDWVGIYDGRLIDLNFSEQILNAEPRQAWQETVHIHMEKSQWGAVYKHLY